MNYAIAVLALSLVALPPAAHAQNRCANASNSRVNDRGGADTHTIRWTIGPCRGTLTWTTGAVLAGDLRSVQLAPGAFFRLSDDDGVHRHELSLTNEAGKTVYDLQVDGRAHVWNADAQSWLADELLMLARRTSLGMNERVAYLLSHGGAPALAAELSFLDGDHLKRSYLTAAMAGPGLNAAQVAALVAAAESAIGSNYEKAAFLLDTHPQAGADAVFNAINKALGSIESDYEKGRVIKQLLLDGKPARVAPLLTTASTMGSDHEKSDILRSIPSFPAADENARQAYFKLTNSMASAYEIHRMASAVMDRGAPAAGAVDLALRTVPSIESDAERAQLLLQILQKHSLNQEQRSALANATRVMGSDYEKQRVLAAITQR